MTVPEYESSPAMLRILGVMETKSNMSVSDLSAEAFVGISTLACGGYLHALRRRKLIYVSGWRKVNGRFSAPLYSLGDLADVPRPRVDETNRDAPGMQKIVETLARYGALTYREIAQFSGLSVNTVKNSGYLEALLVQSRIHIGGWRRSLRGPMSPIYVAGRGTSVAKPQAMTAIEKCRQHRSRSKIAAKGIGLRSQMILLAERPESSQLAGWTRMA
jgi:hypothetical protein